MTRRLAAFAVLATLVVLGCDGSSPTEPAEGGDLAGFPASLAGQLIVIGGGPLPRVEITVGGRTTATATDGTFRLGGLVSGEAEFVARPLHELLGTVWGDLFLVPGGNFLPVPLVDNDSGYLFGRVLDGGTGRPVPGAAVELPGLRSTTTGSDGSYMMDACCSTLGSVLVTAPGYRGASFPVGRVYGGSRALDLLLVPV